MIRSEQFRLRVVAVVILALTVSLIGSAMPKTQASRAVNMQQARALYVKAATQTEDAKIKNKTADKKKGEKKVVVCCVPAEEPAQKPDPCENNNGEIEQTAGERVKLFYMREATKIAEILNAVAEKKGSALQCLLVTAASDDEIILYGTKEKRRHALRIIATLDLPRPGVLMEMWGVQVSSSRPEKMAIVMPAIRDEINRTQVAVRSIYNRMQSLAQGLTMNVDFEDQIETTLEYRSALDPNRPLSLTDILLRMVAANDPLSAAHGMALKLDSYYKELTDSLQKDHEESLTRLRSSKQAKKSAKAEKRPPEVAKNAFGNFFRMRGLNNKNGAWFDDSNSVKRNAFISRLALLDFGLHYSSLIRDPRNFKPYYLQQSAEILNTRLQAAIDALNLDMRVMFIEPALKRIQEIVRNFDDVEYAQVGKTSVASLSGISTEVTSRSVSAFDVTPPLRLSELLEKAQKIADQTSPFIPKETAPGATEAAELTAGALPISQVIGLIGALGEERSVWRELEAGISLTITPNVLRNMTSAELKVDLKIGDPQAGTREDGVRPLSRVSKHDVKTSVYVNALDFFDLSAFISQSTLNGERSYVPIIGPVWRGLFGDVPGLGKLFSWKNPPQTVYHQSLVLTNSFITPTAMGIALLYPIESSQNPEWGKTTFADKSRKIEEYKNNLRAIMPQILN